MISTDHFGKLAPPWVLLSTCDPKSLRAGVRREFPDFVLVTVRGEACRSKSALFDAFARALKFPDYFGHNWDAFDECVNDLEWLEGAGYVVVVTKAERLLADDEAEYSKFIDIMSNAGREWARPPDRRGARPFHVVLVVSSPDDLRRRDWRLTEASFDPASR